LLLITNDGELTKKLTHPSSNVKKIYHVELDKKLTSADLKKITAGIELEDGFIKVDEINYDGDGLDKSQVGIAIHSGKNRVVRRIFESLGYEVKKLDRVIFAGLTKKDLPRGKWRNLSELEVNMLKMIAGTRS
jgi:23S rRNA pseudouridine2605 synthase